MLITAAVLLNPCALEGLKIPAQGRVKEIKRGVFQSGVQALKTVSL